MFNLSLAFKIEKIGSDKKADGNYINTTAVKMLHLEVVFQIQIMEMHFSLFAVTILCLFVLQVCRVAP